MVPKTHQILEKRWNDITATSARILGREEGSSEYTVREEMISNLGNTIASSCIAIHLVKPNEEWCSCGKWQDYKYPCRHALCYFKMMEENILQTVVDKYTHNFYKYVNVHNLYKKNIRPVIIDHLRYDEKTEPPSVYVPTGRPRKKRMRSKSRFIEKKNSTIHCSICKQPGHNKRGCTLVLSSAGMHKEEESVQKKNDNPIK